MWVLGSIGVGLALLLGALTFVGQSGTRGQADSPTPEAPQLTAQQVKLQSSWDSSPSDYRSEQCRLWRSQSHLDYFVNSMTQPTQAEQRLFTWLLDANC